MFIRRQTRTPRLCNPVDIRGRWKMFAFVYWYLSTELLRQNVILFSIFCSPQTAIPGTVSGERHSGKCGIMWIINWLNDDVGWGKLVHQKSLHFEYQTTPVGFKAGSKKLWHNKLKSCSWGVLWTIEPSVNIKIICDFSPINGDYL